jgi:serine/threonine protein kinase
LRSTASSSSRTSGRRNVSRTYRSNRQVGLPTTAHNPPSLPPSSEREAGPRFDCAFCAVRRNRREKQARNSVLHGAGALSGPISGAVQHFPHASVSGARARVLESACRILATVSATGRRRLQFCIGSVGIRLRPLRDGRRYAQRCDKPCSTPSAKGFAAPRPRHMRLDCAECMYESLATGHPPFVSASFSELMKMIVHNEPSPLRSIGPQLQDLLTGLLAKVSLDSLDSSTSARAVLRDPAPAAPVSCLRQSCRMRILISTFRR